MDKVILTPEELKEREELFKHEMTQVFLALKDQYTNTDNIKSPLEGLELTAEDINRKFDYVSIKAPGVNNIPQDVPKTNILKEYTAITGLQPTIALDGIEDLPFASISTVQYAALRSVKLDSASVDVPTIRSIEVFTPLTEINAERITQNIPDVKISVKHAALQPVKLDSISVDIPTIESIRQYTSAAQEFPKIKAVDIPLLSKPLDFMPLEEVKAKPVEVDVPVTKSEIIYKTRKAVNKKLSEISMPIIGSIPKYEPIKDVNIKKSVKPLPVHEISISGMNKAIVEHTKLSPEFALAAEKAAPKDFYSMWANMQTIG